MRTYVLITLFINLSFAQTVKLRETQVQDPVSQSLVEEVFEICKEKEKINMQLIAAEVDSEITKLKSCIEKNKDILKDKQAYKLKENEGTVQFKKDSRLQTALSEELNKKYTKAFFGDEKEQKIISHRDFYVLYRSQLSKSSTLQINTYCLDAINTDPSSGAIIQNPVLLAKETKSQREKNLELLKRKDKININGKELFVQEFVINNCVTGLQKICHAKDDNELDEYITYDKDKDKADKKASKELACHVLQNLRKIGKALRKTEGLLNNLDEANTGPLELTIKQYNPLDKDTGIDALTSMTSSEFEKIKKKALEEDLNKCVSLNDNECIKLLGVTKSDDASSEEKNEAIAKQIIQTEIVLQSIDEIEDEDEMKDLLVNEGHEKVIEAIQGDIESKMQDIKNELRKKYEEERKQSLALLKKRIEDAQGDVDNIDDIKESLASEGDRFQDLLHFNNIITGYLTVSDPNKEDTQKGRNIASFEREVTDNEAADSSLQEALEELKQETGNKEADFNTPSIDSKTIRDDIIRDLEDLRKPAEESSPDR